MLVRRAEGAKVEPPKARESRRKKGGVAEWGWVSSSPADRWVWGSVMSAPAGFGHRKPF